MIEDFLHHGRFNRRWLLDVNWIARDLQHHQRACVIAIDLDLLGHLRVNFGENLSSLLIELFVLANDIQAKLGVFAAISCSAF